MPVTARIVCLVLVLGLISLPTPAQPDEPASRPEFELPTERGCLAVSPAGIIHDTCWKVNLPRNDKAIADELRYLRKRVIKVEKRRELSLTPDWPEGMSIGEWIETILIPDLERKIEEDKHDQD